MIWVVLFYLVVQAVHNLSMILMINFLCQAINYFWEKLDWFKISQIISRPPDFEMNNNFFV